ncbi:phosphatidylserine decarboxylase [Natronospira proteinivora]|uniref:Phosphatidylserine decarboxylase n=1 Tax=Natronospira proteinivora TaxID=1807133 RepID=A0ABT1G5G0_9GAMM|nr:phosphatidylserine decarboxylase [Natronospira proteinivora]MCP1726175.1 phosphatidylserine decarboxylase [Natronospira proteinivora]
MARNGSLIAGEAWWPIAFLLLMSGLALLLPFPWIALLGLLLTVFLIFIFRDPARDIPALPLAVVSPVDGVIEVIEQPKAPEGEPQDTVIVIRIAPLAAWSIRAPVEGKVMGLRGLKEGPTRGLWLQTDEGDDVVTELTGRSRPYWSRPVAFVRTGERLGQGWRFGYRRLAREARVHVYGKLKLEVKAGQRVRAGSDLLATLVHDD